MKILSISTQKPHSTGSGVYLTELVRALDRLGHQQAVVAGIYKEDTINFPEEVGFYPVYYTAPEDDAKGDISYPVLGMSDVMPYDSTRYNQLNQAMYLEMINAFTLAITQAIEELRPEIILCHHLYLLTSQVKDIVNQAADRISDWAPPKVYGLSHGSDLRQYENCPFMRDEIHKGINQLDGILTLHRAQSEDIHRLFHISRDKIQVIGTGYNSEVFNEKSNSDNYSTHVATSFTTNHLPDSCHMNPTESNASIAPIHISYAGKLSTEKGLIPFLDALGELENELGHGSICLALAGGCRDEDIKEYLTGNKTSILHTGILNKLPYHANYLGMLSQEELAEVFRQSHIFVLPSFYEGLPLVVIEAMACGAVPVCTDLPGIKDWISSSIPDSNCVFVAPPRMLSPGKPVPEDLTAFKDRLKASIKGLIPYVLRKQSHPESVVIPHTRGTSWDGVASRISAIFAKDAKEI